MRHTRRSLAVAIATGVTFTLIASCSSAGSASTTSAGSTARSPLAQSAASGQASQSISAPPASTASQGGENSNEPVIHAKFATASAVNSFGDAEAQYFAAELGRTSGGKIQVKVYPNGELGNTETANKSLANGTIQFTSDDVLDAYVPAVDLLELSYLFPSEKVANAALNAPAMYQLLWNQLEPHGIKALAIWPAGFSYLYSTKPVRSTSDMKGLKVRTFDPSVEQTEFAAVGAEAVTVSYVEVYTSLSTNLVGAVTDPPNQIVSLKWYEPAHYITVLNSSYVTDPLLISEKFWKSLDPVEQSQVSAAAKASLTKAEQLADQWNAKGVKTMQANSTVQFIRPDLAPFKNAFRSTYPSFNSKYPGVVAKMEKIISDVANGGGSATSTTSSK